MDNQDLVVLIAGFVKSTPSETIQEILNTIKDWKNVPSDFQKTKLLSSIQNPRTKSVLRNIFNCWELRSPGLTSETVFFSFQSCLRTLQISTFPSPELIWTGPGNLASTFRRTDQALLGLIQGAKDQLLVVSFAVYKAKPIIDAIENAIFRNVKVTICLEDSNESIGKLSFSGLNAFSESIFKLASFYTWPIENRPRTIDGKFGSLHAKIAVADREKVFISSANLTDYALDLNMEMGVLIENRVMGEQITSLFNDMIVNSVLQQMQRK